MFLVAALATSGAIAINQVPPPARSAGCDALDAVAVAYRTQKLDEAQRGHERFTEAVHAALMALTREEICLCKACEFIFNRSAEVYPAFLRHLESVAGGDKKEKIAAVILRHLEALAGQRAEIKRALKNARREFESEPFRAWCRQPWDDFPMCPHHGSRTLLSAR